MTTNQNSPPSPSQITVERGGIMDEKRWGLASIASERRISPLVPWPLNAGGGLAIAWEATLPNGVWQYRGRAQCRRLYGCLGKT